MKRAFIKVDTTPKEIDRAAKRLQGPGRALLPLDNPTYSVRPTETGIVVKASDISTIRGLVNLLGFWGYVVISVDFTVTGLDPDGVAKERSRLKREITKLGKEIPESIRYARQMLEIYLKHVQQETV